MQTVEALIASPFFHDSDLRNPAPDLEYRGARVRPDHRMVAHSGFLTVARKVDAGFVSVGTDPEDGASHDENEP